MNGRLAARVVHECRFMLLYSFAQALSGNTPYIPSCSGNILSPLTVHITPATTKTKNASHISARHDTTTRRLAREDEQTRVGQRDAPSWPALGSDGFGMAQRGTAQASQFYRQGKSSLKKDNGGTAESEYTSPHIVA